MQILKGSKREITMMLWNEQLEKAEKRLVDSTECYNRFKDKDSKEWMEKDKEKVKEIKQQIKEVTELMDARGIN